MIEVYEKFTGEIPEGYHIETEIRIVAVDYRLPWRPLHALIGGGRSIMWLFKTTAEFLTKLVEGIGSLPEDLEKVNDEWKKKTTKEKMSIVEKAFEILGMIPGF